MPVEQAADVAMKQAIFAMRRLLYLARRLPTSEIPPKKKGQFGRFLPNASTRRNGGAEEDRTPDLRIANATLSQLSYRPTRGRGF